MKNTAILISLFILSSCTTQLSEYSKSKPDFILENYFNGQLVAFGMVQDYSEKLTRHFCVNISAEWTENQGTLKGVIDETFYFNDGEIDTRIWVISHKKDHLGDYYVGTAGDVEGEASGRSEGSAFQWQYKLKIPITNDNGDKTTYTFSIDDWIYLVDNDRAFNKSTINKLGVTVGHITLFFDKQQPLRDCSKPENLSQAAIQISMTKEGLTYREGQTFSL